MSTKENIVVFGAGVVFERFVHSGDADKFNINAVLDNHKTGEMCGYPVFSPAQWKPEATDFDLVVLTLWDKPGVIAEVSKQLVAVGVLRTQIKVYSYDRHQLCDLDDNVEVMAPVSSDGILYGYYDLNRSSETYDITSFLATADCYREQQGLTHLHMVIVARDDEWQAQAYCLEQSERRWRAENIVKQACSLIPACSGLTYCSNRLQAQSYLERSEQSFPPDYRLDNPPPVTVHKDFYFWWDQGFDPRRFKSSPKAAQFVSQWLSQQVSGKNVISVTMRESSLQPKRNSDPQQWDQFFAWLEHHRRSLAVVVIRDTENVFSEPTFSRANVKHFEPAAFHMDLRLALYECAYLNMGCSNGPKQLCHLSKTARYITTKMIVEDYAGSSSKRFIDRDIVIGEDFRFAGRGQMIDWRGDTFEEILDSFLRFEAVMTQSSQDQHELVQAEV